MAACALHNTSKMEMLSVDSTRVAAPLHLHGIVMERLTWTTPVTRDTGITADAIVNGILILVDTANLSLPLPAEIVAAFTAAGNPLRIGDAFRVYFQNISTDASFQFVLPTGITDKQSVASYVIAPSPGISSGFLTLVYTALNAFDVYILMGLV